MAERSGNKSAINSEKGLLKTYLVDASTSYAAAIPHGNR